jgi:hypothetical protein
MVSPAVTCHHHRGDWAGRSEAIAQTAHCRSAWIATGGLSRCSRDNHERASHAVDEAMSPKPLRMVKEIEPNLDTSSASSGGCSKIPKTPPRYPPALSCGDFSARGVNFRPKAEQVRSNLI